MTILWDAVEGVELKKNQIAYVVAYDTAETILYVHADSFAEAKRIKATSHTRSFFFLPRCRY